jgi:hypothetical protein
MWHQLWPMHRGYGYLQDYLTGRNLPPLSDYAEALRSSPTQLHVARQWCERDPERERALLATEGVAGLVFSSFRHDNPQAIARGDWRAAPDGAARKEKRARKSAQGKAARKESGAQGKGNKVKGKTESPEAR